jgi:GNAT superfamily N-acetyltransferase
VIFINIEALNKGLSDQVYRLWNDNFKDHYKATEKMIAQKIFNDSDIYNEGTFALMNGTELVGFIVSKINRGPLPEYKNCGWISSLVVDKKYENKGYGSELYAKAEEAFKKAGVKKIIIGGEMDNFFSGIPNPSDKTRGFFSKRGYTLNIDEHYDLMADVSAIDFDSFNVHVNTDSSYETRVLSIEDIDRLKDFFAVTFPGRWEYEIFNYIQNGGDLKNILILCHDDKIKGFCKVFVSREKNDLDCHYGSLWGALGPIGIDADLRGKEKGFGNKILKDSLKYLKQIGAHNVLIDWTVLIKYYGQFGFEPWRTYQGAYKLL